MMIKCPECGKEISDKAASCPNCGYTKNEETIERKYDSEKGSKEKKKNSSLSIWALVLSLFGCTLPIAFILALVDVCHNDKTKKHTGSWFAIIFTSLVSLVFFPTFFSDEGSEEQTIKISAPAESADEETAASTGEFEYGDFAVKYLRHEITKNSAGETVLVVYYDFTNNGDDSQCFDYLVTGTAFQNGVEIESSYWHANEESENSSKEIKKGTTLTVAHSYVLGESRDNVTIEFRPFNMWSDKLLMSLELELKQ